MPKIIYLEISSEILGMKQELNAHSKKLNNAEKKMLKDLRDRHPIQILVAFKFPWWATGTE